MWTTFFILIYFVLAISIVISLLLHGAKPSKTLSWLLAVFTIPLGGILLYLLLGRNRRKNKLLKIKKNAFFNLPRPTTIHMASLEGRYRKLMMLVYRNSHFPPTTHNRLQLLKDGKSTFEAIFNALENA
ncbi:MAG TPA: PLDc N-terminal domain-containing protein, partial [Pricia sp.]|nr:PLDc N-terminal domain-containing protein [Pricia sp.]